MTLNDLLDTYRRHCEEQWSADDRAAWAAQLGRIRASGVAASALKAGDLAPDLDLPVLSHEAGSAPTSLYRLLAGGPLVLKFVSGRSCPSTTLELRAYQRIFEQLRSLGGQLLVVSAHDAEDVALHRARDALSFPIVADPERVAARRFGVLVPGVGCGAAADRPARASRSRSCRRPSWSAAPTAASPLPSSIGPTPACRAGPGRQVLAALVTPA
jgi:peroxiredoxin Q/BCP